MSRVAQTRPWRVVAAALPFLAGALACQSPGKAQVSSPTDPPLALDQEQLIRLADVAITRMDVDRAAELLAATTGPAAARAKARLSIYRADCESALSHLATEAARRQPGAPELLSLADGCHGATTGARVVFDQQRGIWLRFQDEADVVLAPFMMEVIDRARASIGQELGVELPRPVRLDLVRDLFSLSAVSGLPLEAAETTGTVAVARWGRVTMVSPRATREGYPWADTLAHELTHLMLSRATLDRAPLWLQEGVAKRQEERWRESRPFDRQPDPQQVAAQAQATGRSVGVTQLGPSIAMLPSADAAAIAFAEVSSFMEFWIARNGPHALPLLLRDLAYAKDADSAMRSASGLGVADWEHLFRADLEARLQRASASVETVPEEELGPRQLARRLRVSQLLYNAGEFDASAQAAAPALDRSPHVAALRFFVARSAARAGWEHAGELLGSLSDVDGPHAGWLALRGRALQQVESSERADALLAFAVSLDPLLVEAACAGLGDHEVGTAVAELSAQAQQLCRHVRSLPPRGSQ